MPGIGEATNTAMKVDNSYMTGGMSGISQVKPDHSINEGRTAGMSGR